MHEFRARELVNFRDAGWPDARGSAPGTRGFGVKKIVLAMIEPCFKLL